MASGRKRRTQAEQTHDLQRELVAREKAKRLQKIQWIRRAVRLFEKQLASGLSDEDFAESIGISHRQLQRIRKQGNPEASAILISKALKNPELLEKVQEAR